MNNLVVFLTNKCKKILCGLGLVLFLPSVLLGFAKEDVTFSSPFYGDNPLSVTGKSVSMVNKDAVGLEPEGVAIGPGKVSPNYTIENWNLSQGTFSFWIKPETSSADETVLLRGIASPEKKDTGFILLQYKNSLALSTYVNVNGKVVADRPLSVKKEDLFQPGKWYHIVFSWGAGFFGEIYVNGELVCRAEGNFLMPSTLAGLMIGPDGSGQRWGAANKIAVRDFCLLRRPIPASEVISIYTSQNSLETRTTAGEPSVTESALVNVLTIPYAAEEPKVDGKIGDNEYALRNLGWVDSAGPNLSPLGGGFCTSYDSKKLYLALQLQLPSNYPLSDPGAVRDDDAIPFSGDAAFIIIRPEADLTKQAFDAIYLAISPSGKIFDARERIDWPRHSCSYDKKWDGDWKIVSKCERDIWNIEAAIPFTSLGLGVPVSGTTWALSYGFSLRKEGTRLAWKENTIWFDHFDAFGKMIFLDKKLVLNESFGISPAGIFSGLVGIGNNSPQELPYSISRGQRFSTQDIERPVEKKGLVPAGKTVSEKIDFPQQETGDYVAMVNIESGGQVLYSRSAPFVYRTPLLVKVTPRPSADEVKVTCSLLGQEIKKQGLIKVSFVDEAGNVQLKGEKNFTPEMNQIEVPLSMKSLVPGAYKVKIVVFGDDNEKVAESTTDFKKWATPVWLTDRKGLEVLDGDNVYFPWTPLAYNNGELNCWGRKYILGKGGLISGIESQGKSLLSGPVSLKYLGGDGNVSEVSFGAPVARSVQKGRVKVESKGSSPELDVVCTQTFEFDGMDKVELRITPKKVFSAKDLYLEIPVKSADIFNREGFDDLPKAGKLSSQKWLRSTFIWLGDNYTGLTWFAESERNWIINSTKPRGEVDVKGKGAVLKIHLINELSSIDKPMDITMGLEATPVKPFFDGWRGIRLGAWGHKPPLSTNPVPSTDYWSGAYGKIIPANWDVLRDHAAELHSEGFKAYPYMGLISGEYYYYKDPAIRVRPVPKEEWTLNFKDNPKKFEDYWYFKEDWDYVPFKASSFGYQAGEAPVCSVSSSFADYVAYGVYEVLSKTDIDGFYWDCAASTCSSDQDFNKARGKNYQTKDGVQQGTVDVFATRNLYLRIYSIFNELRGPKRKPYLIIHSGSPCMTPVNAFWDILIHGESVRPTKVGDYGDFYLMASSSSNEDIRGKASTVKPDYSMPNYRAQYGNEAHGLPEAVIPQYQGLTLDAAGQRAAIRELFDFTLLNDSLLWGYTVTQDYLDEVWKVMKAFGMADTDFFGYWDNGIKTEPESVKVSYYKKNGKKEYLVIVGNLAKEKVTANVQLPDSLLRNKKVVDAETGTEVTLSSLWKVEIPGRDFRMFIFTGK